MSIKQPPDLFRYLPTSGDGSYLGSEKGHRPARVRETSGITRDPGGSGVIKALQRFFAEAAWPPAADLWLAPHL